MKVREIMNRSVITTSKDTTIKVCGDLMEKHDINGMPIIEGDKVVGVITRADIFKAILPRYPEIYDDNEYYMNFEHIEERINKIQELKVKELMSFPPVTIDPEVSIIRAGSIMVLRRIKQVPVTDNDKLVGIITLTDICRNLLARVA